MIKYIEKEAFIANEEYAFCPWCGADMREAQT